MNGWVWFVTVPNAGDSTLRNGCASAGATDAASAAEVTISPTIRARLNILLGLNGDPQSIHLSPTRVPRAAPAPLQAPDGAARAAYVPPRQIIGPDRRCRKGIAAHCGPDWSASGHRRRLGASDPEGRNGCRRFALQRCAGP